MGLFRFWDRPHRLAKDLESLPVGLEVWHKPDRVLDFRMSGSGGWPYVWHFQTAVRVLGDQPLHLERFGMAAWRRGEWVYNTSSHVFHIRPFWPPDCGVFRLRVFEQEYDCPAGCLYPGKEYWGRRNWAGSGRLETFQQKWFFIAHDADGQRYKGEGIIELISGL
jgi:hypothetical protein